MRGRSIHARPSLEGQRDFLAEAARLDPLAWDLDLSERDTRALGQSSGWPFALRIDHGQAPERVFDPRNATEWSHQFSQPFLDTPQLQSSQYGYPSAVTALGSSGYPSGVTSLGSSGLQFPSQVSFGLSGQNIEGLTGMESHLQASEWAFHPTGAPSPESNFGRKIAEPQEQGQQVAHLENEILWLRKEKEALEKHAKMLEVALMNASKDGDRVGILPTAAEVSDFIPSQGWTEFDPKSSVILNTIFDPPKRISADEAAAIPLQEYAKLWRSYLGAMTACLTHLSDPEADGYLEHEDKLKALTTERQGFFIWVSANNPSICHCLLTMDLGCDQPKRISEVISTEVMEKALKAMKLSEDQVVFLLDARKEFLLSMGYYAASLEMAQAQLAKLDPKPIQSVRNSHFLNWLSVARSLQETVEEMHVCTVKLHFQLYKMKRGLTPHQAVVLMSESFPYIPDVIAMTSQLAAERKAPTATELFKLGSDEFKSCKDHAKVKFVREPHQSINYKIGHLCVMLQQWEAMKESQGGILDLNS